MLERTIWERLRFIPPYLRTKLRRQMAEAMAITEDAVLKHLQSNGWLRLKPLYQRYICKFTNQESENWEEPNTYLEFNEDTYRFYLRELTIEDLEVGEKEGVAA